MVYCAGKLIGNLKYFIKAIDTLSVGLLALFSTWDVGKTLRRACKSLAFGSSFTSCSRVLPTSCVGYHAGKPIESVVWCGLLLK